MADMAEQTGEMQSVEVKTRDASVAEEKQEVKYTDADIDRIIAKKFAAWERKKEDEISEAQKLAEMNAQERAEHERDELQKKLDELMDKDVLSQMRGEARRELAADDINISDDLLNLIVSKDAEATKNAVEAFKTMYKADVSKAVKEALRGNAPKGEGKSNALTKEQILKVADRRERQRLMRNNQNLFKHGGN